MAAWRETKADQPGLVRVQRQFELTQSFVQIPQKGICLMLVLEADDGIIREAHDDYIAGRLCATHLWTHKSYA